MAGMAGRRVSDTYMPYPNLKGVAHREDVEQVRAGSYTADYLNWSRTMQLLRDNAPGWLPDLVATSDGGFVHRGGVGGFLLIRFVHQSGDATPGFPQAIMDNRNQAIALDKITSRDITDTHRRGLCMAAALAFGLAYELWAKMPLESGYESAASAPTDANRGSGAPAGAADDLSAVMERLAGLDPETDWPTALDKTAREQYREPGGLAKLTKQQRDHLAGRMVEHADKLAAALAESAGEPKGTSEALDAAQAEAVVAPSPAETPFVAPKGPRGSKAKEAA